ncbi:MAG: hypothetical protein JXJ18_13030 [Rhodobacteraceae bacterium]|nr:hypothetical protein [Paracoccaceae bacterium]
MQLPPGIRSDVLEFVGATPVADAQLERMLNDIWRSLELQPAPATSPLEGLALSA